MTIGKSEFLVLTHKGADAIRKATGEHSISMENLRCVIVAALNGATITKEYSTRLGDVKEVDVSLAAFNSRFRLSLVWGKTWDGKSIMSPDGKRQVIFLKKAVELL